MCEKLIYLCASDQNEPPFCCTVPAKYSKSTQKSWISHFYITYEILPIKNYASLWYNVWHISWDMSFVHGEARFCVKSWYTSVYQTKTNHHFVVRSRLNIANRLKKSRISHFYVTYEILPIIKYTSLWYNVWHISWDMSFVHGEARCCVKSWYTSAHRTKTNRHFVVQSRLKIAIRLKKSRISHFYITNKILPIKKYTSLWYNVWHKVKTCHLYMEKLDVVWKVDIRLRIGPKQTAILLYSRG